MPSLKVNLIIEQMCLMFLSFLFFFIFFLFIFYYFSLQYIQLLNNLKKQYNLHYFLINFTTFVYPGYFGMILLCVCLFLMYSYYYTILMVILFYFLFFFAKNILTDKHLQKRNKFYLLTILYTYNHTIFIRFYSIIYYLYFIQ